MHKQIGDIAQPRMPARPVEVENPHGSAVPEEHIGGGIIPVDRPVRKGVIGCIVNVLLRARTLTKNKLEVVRAPGPL